MFCFWNKRPAPVVQQTISWEEYSINNECIMPRNYCAETLKLYSNMDRFSHCSIEKTVTMECINTEVSSKKSNKRFTFHAKLPSSLLRQIAETGEENYAKLIHRMLKMLDSTTSCMFDFENNYQDALKDLRKYNALICSYTIDKNSRFQGEIQALFSEYQSLDIIQKLFCQYRQQSDNGIPYVNRYGDACVPQFHFLPAISEAEIATMDFEKAQHFVNNILTTSPLVEKNIRATLHCIPGTREFSLTTLNSMVELARKYSIIFTEYTENSSPQLK